MYHKHLTPDHTAITRHTHIYTMCSQVAPRWSVYVDAVGQIYRIIAYIHFSDYESKAEDGFWLSHARLAGVCLSVLMTLATTPDRT